MADSIATLQGKIVLLINNMLTPAFQDPAARSAAISQYALDLATAIDQHIKSHKTSVENESLV